MRYRVIPLTSFLALIGGIKARCVTLNFMQDNGRKINGIRC